MTFIFVWIESWYESYVYNHDLVLESWKVTNKQWLNSMVEVSNRFNVDQHPFVQALCLGMFIPCSTHDDVPSTCLTWRWSARSARRPPDRSCSSTRQDLRSVELDIRAKFIFHTHIHLERFRSWNGSIISSSTYSTSLRSRTSGIGASSSATSWAPPRRSSNMILCAPRR